MPPLVWNLQADDAQAILTAVATTIRAGLAVPRPLTAVIAESQRGARSRIARPPPDACAGDRAAGSTTPSISGIAGDDRPAVGTDRRR